jgi:hypothetical protein
MNRTSIEVRSATRDELPQSNRRTLEPSPFHPSLRNPAARCEPSQYGLFFD